MQTPTAIITGASEGLGKFLSIEMAHRGHHLVLVALPQSGLPQLAEFLQKNFNICVHYFEMDLTDVNNCVELFRLMKDNQLSADILINNAGIGNNDWFHEKSVSFYARQITLNVMAPVVLTRLFLERPGSGAKRYILNVGSLSSVFVVPKKGVYGATKSFIRHFTKSLQLELQGTNVSATLLNPGGINTKPELLVMHQSLKGISRVTVREPEDVAKKAIDGMFEGKKEIIPGFFNRVFVTLNRLLPSGIQDMLIKRNMKSVL